MSKERMRQINDPVIERAGAAISHLMAAIELLFLSPVKITVVIRDLSQSDGEGDVVVLTDDPLEAIKALKRRLDPSKTVVGLFCDGRREN